MWICSTLTIYSRAYSRRSSHFWFGSRENRLDLRQALRTAIDPDLTTEILEELRESKILCFVSVTGSTRFPDLRIGRVANLETSIDGKTDIVITFTTNAARSSLPRSSLAAYSPIRLILIPNTG